jgi:hypothetical protein
MLTRGKKHYRNMPSACSEFHLLLCDRPKNDTATVSLYVYSEVGREPHKEPKTFGQIHVAPELQV